MARTNNYLIQAQQAKERFLSYDQQKLVGKLHLESDEEYLYTALLGRPYRINRKNGDITYRLNGHWQDGNSFEEVLTLLDLVCDSRPDRYVCGRWKNMMSFGLQFHQNLLEEERNPLAEAIERESERFAQICTALGGKKLNAADLAYSFDVFDGLPLALFFWAGDDEFAPRVRWFWDENALMYIRYETMYYAVNLLEQWMLEKMA